MAVPATVPARTYGTTPKLSPISTRNWSGHSRELELGPFDGRKRATSPFAPPYPKSRGGHDFHAAADGQLGGIMKVFRDWQDFRRLGLVEEGVYPTGQEQLGLLHSWLGIRIAGEVCLSSLITIPTTLNSGGLTVCAPASILGALLDAIRCNGAGPRWRTPAGRRDYTRNSPRVARLYG